MLAVASADREGLGSPSVAAAPLARIDGVGLRSRPGDLAQRQAPHRLEEHLTYDPVRAETSTTRSFSRWRSTGPGKPTWTSSSGKEFASYRFNPAGGHVFDRLIDGRLDPD